MYAYPPQAALMITILSFSLMDAVAQESRGTILLLMAMATPAAGMFSSAARSESVAALVDVGLPLIFTSMLPFVLMSIKK